MSVSPIGRQSELSFSLSLRPGKTDLLENRYYFDQLLSECSEEFFVVDGIFKLETERDREAFCVSFCHGNRTPLRAGGKVHREMP